MRIMKTENEKQLILAALKSKTPASSVNQACRDILLGRIDNGNFPDSNLKDDLINLLYLTEFINLEYVQKEETENVVPQQKSILGIGFLGILGAFGIGSIIWGSTFLRLIGCGFVGFSGYRLGLYRHKPKPIKRNKMMLATTVDDIFKKVNDLYEKSSILLNHPYLKTRGDDSVIKSMYELLKLSDDKGKEIKDLVKEILTDNFKVKFVDHAGEYATGDYFKYTEFKNLEKPETILQALVSSKSNESKVCIAKGIRKTYNSTL